MHRYHKLGKVAKKRHTVFRDDNGKIYHEELKGNKGFVGPSSLLYHIYPPTEVISTKQIGSFKIEGMKINLFEWDIFILTEQRKEEVQ